MQPEQVTATVFNIQKFCTDDGPGIRTTVFLKGCSLRCSWCHNPEGLQKEPVVEYDDRRCAFCGKCAAVCPAGCHTFEGGIHRICREKCIHCGKCGESCEFGALRMCGKTVTAEEVLRIAMADKGFYAVSGGGITVSGGEPLLQADFVQALFTLAKAQGIHTCVETGGAVDFSALEKVQPVTDLFLYDIKETDEENHKKYTGASNGRILENLKKLDALGASVCLRCPVIPGVNDRPSHFARLRRLYAGLEHGAGLQLMPYHVLGQGKTERYGLENASAFPVPTAEQIEKWHEWLETN